MNPAAEPVRPGQVVNGYRVLERLGAGGMGLVYKAVDIRLDRHVALKFLPSGAGIDEDGRAALVNEARAASALDHPNIGTIHGIEDAPGGRQFMVMAYYEGQTLAQKLRSGPLPPEEAAQIALQVASGLAEAHAHRIVHRDVKPSNIFLTRQGLVKILDFGIARIMRSATCTRSGNIAGTAAYMSPEQAQGGFLDARTDLWSLGAVIYEMIAGRRAFTADDVPATLYAIVNAPPADLGDDVPPALRMIVYHALAKSPPDRYQSAAEMVQDLGKLSGPKIQRGDPTLTPGDISRYRKLAAGSKRTLKRRRFLKWQLAPVLVVVTAVVFLSLRNRDDPEPAAYESYLKAAGLIQRYEKPGNVDQAISLLRGAVKTDPNFALAYASLGEAYWQKSRLTKDPRLLEDAESHAKRALQLDDSLAPVQIVMGEVQGALGNRELAQEHYRRALRLDPANTAALFGLAGELAARQRITEAEGLYGKAVALQPGSWEGYNTLGVFLKGQRRPEEAAEQFRRVIELTPDNIAGYVNLAAVLIDGGHLDEAEAPLQKASQLDPSSYTAHLNLGVLYSRRRLFPQAEKTIRRALELNDKDWLGWVNLAVLYRRLSQGSQAVAAYKRAIPLLEEAVRLQPKQAALWARLAEIYAYDGQSDRSLSAIRTALALDPDDASILLGCADAYAALGSRNLAVATANQAVETGLSLAQLDEDPEALRFRADPNFKPPRR